MNKNTPPQQYSNQLPHLNNLQDDKKSVILESNFQVSNYKKNPIPQAILQEKITSKNQMANKLNEFSSVFSNVNMNMNKKLKNYGNDTVSISLLSFKRI